MRIRKPTIPDEALGQARNARDAVRAAIRSPEVRAVITRLVKKVGFRQYRPADTEWGFKAAVAALGAFFETGSSARPERLLASAFDPAAEYADLMDDIRRSQPFAALLDGISEAVAKRFPKVPAAVIAARTAEQLCEEIIDAVDAADGSSPLDAIRGSEVVVCYVPGLGKSQGLAATMTSFWTEDSSSLTVVPDAAFMHMLSLANVSVGEWLTAVEKTHGERIDEAAAGASGWQVERAAAWARAEAATDPGRPPAVKPARLVLAVDACYLGFTPMVAFNADAGALCARDWNTALAIRGGVLGLHDFVNGSGDPLRFESRIVVQAAPENMMVGEGRACDFTEVHGFLRRSFRSEVTDEELPAFEGTHPPRP